MVNDEEVNAVAEVFSRRLIEEVLPLLDRQDENEERRQDALLQYGAQLVGRLLEDSEKKRFREAWDADARVVLVELIKTVPTEILSQEKLISAAVAAARVATVLEQERLKRESPKTVR